jgi:hypothetical protein
MKGIKIFIMMSIGVILTSIGLTMIIYGITSFFVPSKTNTYLDTIGVYFFFISIPIIALGIYIIVSNWKKITYKSS